MKALIVFFLLLVAHCVGNAETYVVCVGIANYAENKVPNLAKTENDAKAMAEFFRKGTKNVVTITGKYATKKQILKTLKSQFQRAKKGDRIIFFFSGHGYPGGFCPYEMSQLEDGLTYAEVAEVMKKSKASSKFLIADACNSGAIRKGKASSKPISQPTEIMMFLSSRGKESSVESQYSVNGVFTKHLLRGLRGAADTNGDRSITARELYKYVSSEVIRQTQGAQHPVMYGKFPEDMVIVKYSKK